MYDPCEYCIYACKILDSEGNFYYECSLDDDPNLYFYACCKGGNNDE